jgi:hypothetical protein
MSKYRDSETQCGFEMKKIGICRQNVRLRIIKIGGLRHDVCLIRRKICRVYETQRRLKTNKDWDNEKNAH